MNAVDIELTQIAPPSDPSAALLAQQVHDWQVLHVMSTGLLRARSLKEQCDVILKTVADLHGCAKGMISLYDPGSATLVAQSAMGFGPAWLAGSASIPVGMGGCGSAYQERSRVVIDDVSTDARFAPYRELARREGVKALYSTPFFGASGEPLGVLTVHLGASRKPTEREMQLADVCAGQLALVVERVRSEQQLHEEMLRSHQILKTMNEGFLLMDGDFRIVQINTEGLRIDGRRSDDIVGLTHWEAWPGSEAAPLGQAYKRAMAERRPVRFENHHRVPGGDKWFTVHAYPYGDGLAVIYRDITDLKLANAQLKEAQERLEATLTAGEVGTWIWDIREDRVWADQNLARLFGRNVGEASGAPVAAYLDAVHPDDAPALSETLNRALAQDSHFQARYRVGSGAQYRWLLAQGRIERDDVGMAVRMPGVILDVTRQKEIEDILRVTEERYRAVISAMDDGFCVIELLFDEAGKACDYRFVETNPAFERQSGLQDMVGKRARDLLPELEQKWFDLYGEVVLSGRSANFIEESPIMGRWFEVFATRLGNAQDRCVAVLFTDITQRQNAELHLRREAADLAASNQRKTEFIATLAHELRNPLAPMRTGLDFMRLAGNMPASYAKVHQMMDRQLRQMVSLIDDLTDVARIGSGKIELKIERVNLKQAIADSVEAAFPRMEAAHHHLIAHVPDEPLHIDADATRIAQILGNLLTNAAKYTPDGGTIAVRAQADGKMACVSVTDNGIGIPKDAQKDLFDLFSQVPGNISRAQGGLGIGLSLVKSLVQLHGGTIAVSSEGAGKGSTFVVELPLHGSA
jgi:PAS domain S-box-containing protein